MAIILALILLLWVSDASAQVNLDAARMQARLNVAKTWQFPDVPQGGAVWVFAVD